MGLVKIETELRTLGGEEIQILAILKQFGHEEETEEPATRSGCAVK